MKKIHFPQFKSRIGYFESIRYVALVSLFLGVLFSTIHCKSKVSDDQNKLFAALTAEQTGVTFANNLTETESWNIIQYLYFYNGGGVAVGDVNNDKLPDIYFTANQGANKLYLNKGNFKFEDVTDRAGVADTEGWKTGVTMTDLNADGFLDIYVCHVSKYKGLKGKNRLFINNGNGTFTDKAAEFGLDATGLCTQAAFFDSDNDGDLDCYLMKHSVHSPRSYRPVSFRAEKDSLSSDVLYKNYGGTKFVDESAAAGISDGSLGYGLGLSVGDLNGDGAPDIYVGNDFHDNDYLYYNDGTGKYTEGVAASMGHTANFSMGNDMADFNNDCLPDIVGLDMKPEEETILKASGGADSYTIYDLKTREFGYLPQFPRNMLQLNRGTFNPILKSTTAKTPANPSVRGAIFSEIGQYSGVATTDWSWASLFADLDNDGWKDLYITNGIVRRPNDLDYIKYTSNSEIQQKATDLQLAAQMPDGKAANYAFRNKADLTFENTSETWNLNQFGFSNGAAYADFDNDGDLDLVVNNINAPALILQNKSEQFTKNHFLRVKLIGKGGNTEGVGAKVLLYSRGGLTQVLEQQPTRGFQSSVEPILHFGIPKVATNDVQLIDSVRVIWRDGSTELVRNLTVNQTIRFNQKNAKEQFKGNLQPTALALNSSEGFDFQDITSKLGLKYKHNPMGMSDFDTEKLIPHLVSTDYPKLVVDDLNNDGLEDLYIHSFWQKTAFFIQNKTGFAQNTEGGKMALPEDIAAGFLKNIYQNLVAKPADFDGDGHSDLFIGCRNNLTQYGLSPKSYLLRNDGKGNYQDVTPQYAPLLDSIGMVTDAVWTDLNGDKRPDLVVVGEWMPLTFFYNTGEDFEPIEIDNTAGWWKCVKAADLDNDGDQDLVIGNMGLNSNWQATPAQPMSLYVTDVDKNGDLEPIISYWRQGTEWPYNAKDELTAQMPSLRKRFPDYAPFARSRFNEVFSDNLLRGALHRKIQQFASVVLINNGDRNFELRTLPNDVQFSTVEAILIQDFNGDGKKDLALGGNFHEMAPSIGKFDASVGSILRGDGKGNFVSLNPQKTNFLLRGAVRDIQAVGGYIVVTANNASLQIFEVKKEDKVNSKNEKRSIKK